MISTVLFDMDGTLLDTTELTLSAFNYTWLQYFKKPFKRDLWDVGRVLRKQFLVFEKDEQRVDAMLETFRDHVRERHDDLCRIYPGIPEMLDNLSGHEIKMGIVSSKVEELVRRELSMFNIDRYFDVFICADNFPVHKPDARPILHAMEQLSAEKSATLFVGDSTMDIQAAHNAGIPIVAVLWGPGNNETIRDAKPDYIASSLNELESYILEL